MKRATKLTLILLVTLVFIAACTQKQTASKGRFVGGTSGLTFSFMIDEPPEIVSDSNQDEFDIGLALENVGEEDIAPSQVIATLNGLEKDAFSLSSLSAKNIDPLEGKKKLADRVIPGEQGEIIFNNLKYKEKLPADLEVELRADVCYEYGTRAIADMCLKKEPNKRGTDDICEITDEAVNVDNSAAPVRITNFAQRASGASKVKFTFDIEKSGSGDVFESGTFSDKCTVNDDKLNRVNVNVGFIGSGATVSCNLAGSGSKGTVKLLSGKRTVRCEVSSIAQDIAFRKSLQMKLDYVYKDSVTKYFTVESSE